MDNDVPTAPGAPGAPADRRDQPAGVLEVRGARPGGEGEDEAVAETGGGLRRGDPRGGAGDAETAAGSAHAACALHAWRLRAALKHAISAVALRTWAPLTVEELAHLLPLSGAPVHPAHCHLIWDHLGDHNPELFARHGAAVRRRGTLRPEAAAEALVDLAAAFAASWRATASDCQWQWQGSSPARPALRDLGQGPSPDRPRCSPAVMMAKALRTLGEAHGQVRREARGVN